MGDVVDQLKKLEARRQELLSLEARAAASAERAKEDLQKSQEALTKMGFSSVDEAQQWLQKTSTEISEKMSALDKSLTEAGV